MRAFRDFLSVCVFYRWRGVGGLGVCVGGGGGVPFWLLGRNVGFDCMNS